MTQHSLTLPLDTPTMRLDQALAKHFTDYSRAQLQHFIQSGQVSVNGKVLTKNRAAVGPQDTLQFTDTAQRTEVWLPQAIPLTFVHEDDDLLIVNKPSPMVVHPGAGVYENTLVNALLGYDRKLESLPRAGLIHRLDKETTGLLIVARSLPAFNRLTQQMQAREIKREYQAIVSGPLVSGGLVDAPIGRHPRARVKMSVLQTGGRQAVTHYRIMDRFRYHTQLKLQLETGRTHQIRVHMQHIRHPIVGDPMYSRQNQPKKCSKKLQSVLTEFQRQALHACKLTLTHPISDEEMSWSVAPPNDYQLLLEALRDNESHQQ